jgi:hypothetical protein
LKSGGILLLTVHGTRAGKSLDSESQEILHTYGFVHKHSEKLRGLVPDWYQTTWHSREYVVKRLSPWFKDIRYSVVADGQQDIVTARKADS